MRTRTILAAAALLAAGALLGGLPIPTTAQETKPQPGAKSEPLTPTQLAERALHRRAVEAVIWGMPAVNFNLMYQAMVNETHGSFNKIVYWSRLPDWKNQTLTPNPDAIDVMPFFNTYGENSTKDEDTIDTIVADWSDECSTATRQWTSRPT